MAYGPEICACCGARDGIEEHHLYLRSEGCPDDLTVYLCHTCHGRAHGMDRVNIRSATTAALAHKKAVGEVYSALPLGYVDQDGRLVPVEEELAVAADIKAMRSNGMSLEKIAADLNARGVIGKRGGKFHGMTVKKILENSIHA